MKKSALSWKSILRGAGILVAALFAVSMVFPNTFESFAPNMLNDSYTSSSKRMASSSYGGTGDMAMEMAMVADEEGFSNIIDPLPPVGADGIAAEQADRQIIRTGNLSLIVEDVEMALKEIKKITTEDWKGFVSEANMREVSDDSRSGWMSLRVPAQHFDSLVGDVKGLAVRVESENVRADDVTRQVVDNEARLTNMRREEEQYREILASARLVEDVLQVTRELNRVRGQIEWLEGQQKNLKEEVAYSTLQVNLTDEGDVEVFGIYWKPLVQAKQALRGALENATESIDSLLVIIFNIPLLLFWGFIAYLTLKFGLRWGRKLWSRIH